MYSGWFDGACWPNPNGHAACGALVKRDGVTIWEYSEYLGTERTSNNLAEFAGLAAVLKWLVENGVKEATVYGDSLMVIGMATRRSAPKAKRRASLLYVPQWERAMSYAIKVPLVKYAWIPRERNTEADALSTKPLIERGLREPVYGRWNNLAG